MSGQAEVHPELEARGLSLPLDTAAPVIETGAQVPEVWQSVPLPHAPPDAPRKLTGLVIDMRLAMKDPPAPVQLV